jgi:hypothetical protein
MADRGSGQPLPITHSDLSPKSQRKLDSAMGAIGRGAKKDFLEKEKPGYDAARAALRGGGLSDEARVKAGKAVERYEGVREHAVGGQSVTMEGAVNARHQLVQDAVARARRHGHTAPYGAMWYPEHNEDITRAARANGFDARDAITASSVMSPNNAPANEKASVIAQMDALRNHSVTVTPQLHEAVKKASSGTVGLDEHIGSTVAMKDLSSRQLAYLSHTTVQPQVQHTGADLFSMGKGGAKSNIAKSINVLRGIIPRDKANNPHTAPKVATYNHIIQASQFESPLISEYAHRWNHVVTQDPGQTRIDTGHGTSEEGMLDPKRAVQDTWMNAINHTSQPNIMVGRSTNIAKTIGSSQDAYLGGKTYMEGGKRQRYHPDPAVTPSELHHSWGQHADELTAHKLTAGRDFTLPGHASQAPAWTEERIQGGNDKEYNKALLAHKEQMWKDAAPAPGQLDMFRTRGGEHLPATRHMSRAQFSKYHQAAYTSAINKGRQIDQHLAAGTKPIRGMHETDLRATQSYLDHEAASREPDIQGMVAQSRKQAAVIRDQGHLF